MRQFTPMGDAERRELLDRSRAAVRFVPVQGERGKRLGLLRADAEVTVALEIQEDRAGKQRAHSNVRRNPVLLHKKTGARAARTRKVALRVAEDRCR